MATMRKAPMRKAPAMDEQGFFPGLLPPITLDQALAEVAARSRKGHRHFYQALDADMSALVRAHYRSSLTLPLDGHPSLDFRTPGGVVLATGYRRIVVGDYGAFIEFTPEQIRRNVLVDRYPGRPNRPVKYLRKRPFDGSEVKIYEQVGVVAYADYQPGFYYVAPDEVSWGMPAA